MKKRSEYPISKFNESALNGIYYNSNDSSIITLWEMLYRSYSFKDETLEMKKDFLVSINKLDNEKLAVSLLQNEKVIKEIILFGEMDENYFSIKRKFFLIPIPALMIIKNHKNLIANSSNGDLVIIHGYRTGGWILIMATDGGGISSETFKKVKD